MKIESEMIAYANDTVIITSGNDWKEVYRKANTDMAKIKRWLENHKLTLNGTKTKCMPYKINKIKDPEDSQFLNLKIHTCGKYEPGCGCEEIEMKEHIKYLGITIDEKMKWTEHIKQTAARLRQTIHTLLNIRSIVTQDTMRKIYHALVHSIIEYGIITWGNAYQKNLRPLEIIQKMILRIAFWKPRYYPSNMLFATTKIPDVRQAYMKN
ncbi:uncharacterized protein LOC124411356 [Diprion similis]|uniref:uncharacterized protein LOC124411356 n=1 Tax=Diprion similis TaxID=362088 RepID=UPI001EF8D27B|nr:uncharacterized protein LOC124411356 [Diprion similis]